MLVVAGIAASFLPGVETVEFDPDVVLLLVLTPLLYSAALESSYLGIRANLRPIGLLAVGLSVFTRVRRRAGGLVAWCRTDAARGAGARRGRRAAGRGVGAVHRAPARACRGGLMTILGGESLVNDATALTLFRVFVAVAAGTGITLLGGGSGMFLLAAVGGTAIGLAIGWLVHRIRRKLDDSAGGERARARRAVRRVPPRRAARTPRACSRWSWPGSTSATSAPESGYATRLQEQAVWQASDTILESVVFALIGLQLTSRACAAAGDAGPLLVAGLVVTRRPCSRGSCGCSRPPTCRGCCSAGSGSATRPRRGRCRR